MAKLSFKKGDTVEIIAGDDKGKRATVMQVFPTKEKLIVEDVKIAKKTVKPTEQNPQGGFENREMPIHVSNVKKVEEA